MDEAIDRQSAVTALLESAVTTGEHPVDRLWPPIHDDLRAMAHRQLLRERAGHSIVTTALVHEALERLGQDNLRLASVVEARFFAGMSVEETAGMMNISPRTVKSDRAFARAWVRRELNKRPAS